ncbi:MAG: hypothetical protein A2942_02625 [Candidatus Lloydbacteria bacterium RIFCSPLOWO2_01_FULL_50_20]|uniref:Uncharacterized protein n=1 Tax=Candidatus Lloydbacteria bacterium RIFCSPLOWO2_01_FULL_50_20 TaxID=1798665 RepID=A0A1G2DEF2_9BACT|nr:MAG: hypothetical protein A3C13_04420 [Candidatus Lloydbacteria bacterium RIFCSPHIGHO2_02_FULL_50_11]OGZ11822.1 MAG: hypothetical protein A2942_02625 [Candidatus Lloydbacteria bacterium RIFCSPLOWO2_01_FULL_50_20]
MYANDVKDGVSFKTPDWAAEFPFGAEVAVGKTDDPTWGVIAGYTKDPQIEAGRVNGEPFYNTEKGCFVCVMLYGGSQMLFSISDVFPWKSLKKEGGMLGKFLCKLNMHAWEKRVSHRSSLRLGASILFVTFADQGGLQCCERSGCRAERRVTRSGILGAENMTLRWRPVRK